MLHAYVLTKILGGSDAAFDRAPTSGGVFAFRTEAKKFRGMLGRMAD